MAQLAVLDQFPAHRERLLREIMCVEGVSWQKAHEFLETVDEENRKSHTVQFAPYAFNIVCSCLLGVLSVLFVFHKPAAVAYNEHMVHENMPEDKSIDEMTNCQVGTWTWS